MTHSIFFSTAPDSKPQHIELHSLMDTAGTVFTANNGESYSPFTGEKAERISKDAPVRLDFAQTHNMIRIGVCGSCNHEQLAHHNDVAEFFGESDKTLHCVSCGDKYPVNVSVVDFLSADSEIEAKDNAMAGKDKDEDDNVSEFDKEIMESDAENDMEDVTDGDAEALLEADTEENEDESDEDSEDETSEDEDEDSESEDDEESDEDEDEASEMSEITDIQELDEADFDTAEDVTSEFEDVSGDEEELIDEGEEEDMVDEAALKEALANLGITDETEDTASVDETVDAPVIENKVDEPVVDKPADVANEVIETPAAEVALLAGTSETDNPSVLETRVDSDIARGDAVIECMINDTASRYYVFVNGNPAGYLSREKSHSDNASVFDTAGYVKGFTLQYRQNRDLSRFGFVPYVVRTDVSKHIEAEFARKEKELVDVASTQSTTRLETIRSNLAVATLASIKGLTPNPLRDKLVERLDTAGFEGAASIVNSAMFDAAADLFSQIVNEAISLSDKSADAQAIYKDTVERTNYGLTNDVAKLVSRGKHVPEEKTVIPQNKDIASTDTRSTNSFAVMEKLYG